MGCDVKTTPVGAGIQIGATNYCGDKTPPPDLVVDLAEWGTVQNKLPVAPSTPEPPRRDPLVIWLNPSCKLVPGGKLLFLNTSDPDAAWPCAEQMDQAIKDGRVGMWPIPQRDPGNRQMLTFSDKFAHEGLKLVPGCEFEMRQMDPAGNLDKVPANIVLLNDGISRDTPGPWYRDNITPFGDVSISPPDYRARITLTPGRGTYFDSTTRSNYSVRTSDEYVIQRYGDTTPPVVHPDRIKMVYDGCTDKVTVSGDKAIERTGATLFIKNCQTQETFEIKGVAGNVPSTQISLRPTDLFSMGLKDRHGVMTTLVDQQIFNPLPC